MLTLVVRRARAQRRLLAAVVLLVAAASGFVGICTQLLGATQDRSFHIEVERSEAADVDVTAYVVGVAGPDLETARTEAGEVVGDVLAALDPSVSSATTSEMRRLVGSDDLAYLVSSDDVDQRADLVSGRWPGPTGSGPPEAALPETAARLLDLRVGDRVRLDGEVGLDGVDGRVTVVLSGTFRPRARAGWESDPLGGQGHDPAYSDGSVTAPAYGPLVVNDAAFVASGSTVSGLRVTAHPTLRLAEDDTLRAAVTALDGATGLLEARLDDRARIARVGSDLPTTLDRVHAQQATTRATVLVVLLLGTALAVAAALLAGWLVAAVRDDERALVVALGLGRRQQLGLATGEALLLAGVAALLAVPAAALGHARLTQLPDLRAAGLAAPVTVSAGLVLGVLASAVLLALALVVTAWDTGTTTAATARRWALARGGVDLLLLAVAAVAWWQLRTRPPGTATRDDVTLTVAPVLCVAAVTVVAVRLVPLLLGLVARATVRSRGLVGPLAVQQATRRPHPGTSMVLVAAAVAAAVLGLALRTTWERSQVDQAALRIGTDLALALPAPASAVDAGAVVDATAGQPGVVVSPLIDRPLVLGRYVGEPGSPPVLVAVDTRQAGGLLRGRLDPGRSWAEVGAGLAPDAPVAGLPLGDGTVELVGRAPDGVALQVVPTAVVQDATGFRSATSAEMVPLDGRAHPLAWRTPIGPDRQLVAVRLEVEAVPGAELPATTAQVSVRLRVPQAGAGAPDWRVTALGRDTPVRGSGVAVDGAGVTVTAGVDVTYLAYTGVDLLATAFAPPEAVPVAVSQDLVDAVGAGVGDELSALVAETVLPLQVAAVVPTVPSAPGRVAVLADADTVSRALLAAGRSEPVVDGWWVGDPTPATADALRALEVGDVTTRDDLATELAQGPLRVTVPTALLGLTGAAVVLLLAGVGLLLGGDRQRRAAEVTRLRALGLTRQDVRRLLLLEHAAFLVPLVALGGLVGGLAATTLGPHLVRSDLGAAPVPEAVVAWPWAAEGLLVGALLLGSLTLVAVVTARQARAEVRR